MKNKAQNIILKNALLDESINFHCLLDIDEFENFNSQHSYEKGNKILYELSNFGKNILKSKYWIHIGNDEFYFSLHEKELTKESLIFQFMRKIEIDLRITVSIEILNKDSNISHKTAFLRLKSNIQVAKSQGGNKIILQ